MATYQQGNRGSGVSALQDQLRQAGYNIASDGIYGPQTAAAVRDFQTRNNLTVDGIAGPQTMGSLNSRQSVPSAQPQYSFSMPKFSYNPKKDEALQQDLEYSSQAVMEQMNERGILNSDITQGQIARVSAGLTAQYREQAFNRWQAQINARRAEISDAMNRVQVLGHVDNYASQVLGIPAGTPSYQAQRDANEFQQKLQLMDYEMKLKKMYTEANSADDEIPVPEELLGYRGPAFITKTPRNRISGYTE